MIEELEFLISAAQSFFLSQKKLVIQNEEI